MKIYNSIKKICKNCKIIKRNKYIYILCSSFYKHKQRQKFNKKY